MMSISSRIWVLTYFDQGEKPASARQTRQTTLYEVLTSPLKHKNLETRCDSICEFQTPHHKNFPSDPHPNPSHPKFSNFPCTSLNTSMSFHLPPFLPSSLLTILSFLRHLSYVLPQTHISHASFLHVAIISQAISRNVVH